MKIVYHGTSSKFLHPILKQGLLPNPKQKTYEVGSNIESYGGVYFSIRKENAGIGHATYTAAIAAAQKFGGNKLYIMATIGNNPNFVTLDEDELYMINGAIPIIRNKSVIFWYLDKRLVDDYVYEDKGSIEAIMANLEQGIDKLIKDAWSPFLQRLVHLIRNNNVKQGHKIFYNISPLLKTYIRSFILHTFYEEVGKPVNKVDLFIINLLNKLGKGDIKSYYRSISKKMLKQLRHLEGLRPYMPTIRSERGIGYSGKNRILAVVEDFGSVTPYSNTHRYSHKLTVHYLDKASPLKWLKIYLKDAWVSPFGHKNTRGEFQITLKRSYYKGAKHLVAYYTDEGKFVIEPILPRSVMTAAGAVGGLEATIQRVVERTPLTESDLYDLAVKDRSTFANKLLSYGTLKLSDSTLQRLWVYFRTNKNIPFEPRYLRANEADDLRSREYHRISTTANRLRNINLSLFVLLSNLDKATRYAEDGISLSARGIPSVYDVKGIPVVPRVYLSKVIFQVKVQPKNMLPAEESGSDIEFLKSKGITLNLLESSLVSLVNGEAVTKQEIKTAQIEAVYTSVHGKWYRFNTENFVKAYDFRNKTVEPKLGTEVDIIPLMRLN